jgi:hypothetical protein
LVVLDDSRYVTAGYRDQSIQVFSLPDGERLQDWTIGRWYSSRRITHIAVINGRLLVASGGGRIEERSLETGEVLWSVRPCRGGPEFHRSSQNRHIGSSFRQVVNSINTNDRVYYSCGTRLGTIQWTEGGWQHHDLSKSLSLPGRISSVEDIPDTPFVVLTAAEGEVLVVNRDSGTIVQTLQRIADDNPHGVTYAPASRQLVVMGEDHKVYVYHLNADFMK